MRNIAIVGAGQAGLQLALGLLKNGYRVTLVSERSAEDFLQGCIMSNQAMFDTALEFERQLDIDFWQELCPQNETITFTLGKPGTSQMEFQWQGFVDKPFQSVDQRIKFSSWLQKFEQQGGKLIQQKLNLLTLDELANTHDLTIVASGKGELSKIFQRDFSRSSFSEPMRALLCLYVRNMQPISENPGVRSNIIPGVGEYFTMPGLTLGGPCEMMLFEGLIGRPFDCWHGNMTSEQLLTKAVALLKEFIPWEATRCADIKLCDEKASLSGSFVPEVRRPTAQLPSGKFVLGIGDAVMLNDPIAGQGSNNASKAAWSYLNSILARGDKEFDQLWMNSVFNQFWKDAQWSVQLSNLLLLPPTPSLLKILTAASTSHELANKLANGFNSPASLFPWLLDPEEATKITGKCSEAKSVYADSLRVVGA